MPRLDNLPKKIRSIAVAAFLLLVLPSAGIGEQPLNASVASAPGPGDGISVGVYYFPGWKESPDLWWNPPWDKIKPFPELEPLLGWYPEGETWVAEKHIEWMHDYGIDFVIYDWYWRKDNTVGLEHAINAYLRAENRSLVDFTILWANHSEVPESLDQFEAMVDFWIENYFNRPEFLKRDGKPVIYIFSPERLRENAPKTGKSVKELLEFARGKAVAAGYKGIYFVACTQAFEYWVKGHIPESGYDAMTAYNYHRGYSGKYEEGGLSESYTELADGYRQSWDWIIANSKLPYFVPVTSGWSKKPWGSHTAHDESISTPELFSAHLHEAKQTVEANPLRTGETIVICCWNEFGEGSYIEPTVKYGHLYLEAVNAAFGVEAEPEDTADQPETSAPVWPWNAVIFPSPSSKPSDMRRLLKDDFNINSIRLAVDLRENERKKRVQQEGLPDESIKWASSMLDSCKSSGVTCFFSLSLPAVTSEDIIRPAELAYNVRVAGALARYFKDRGPEFAGYEFNELVKSKGDKLAAPHEWPGLKQEIVAEIRKHDPERWIILTRRFGLHSGSGDNLPPAHSYIIYGARMHEPYLFYSSEHE